MFPAPPSRSLHRAARWSWLTLVAVSGCFPWSTVRAATPVPPVNVVLVHGIYDTGMIFKPMVRKLEAQGYRCFSPALTPNDGSAGIRALSLQLARAIDVRFGKSAPVVLIGFSMGGLVTRDYVQNLAASGRVRAVFLISPPNHGTLWTVFAHGGIREMGTNSRFLQTLNRDTRAWQRLPVCTYWTPLDLIILPATSSLWPVGDSKAVLCLWHPWMVRNPRLVKDVTARIIGITEQVQPTNSRRDTL